MEPDTEQADRFLRIFLMHRYAKLIEKVNMTFAPSPDKLDLLKQKIIHIDWVDDAIIQNKDEDDLE